MPVRTFIYLDQRAWVSLTRPAATSLLARLEDKARDGAIVVAISLANIIETARTPHRDQRARLARMMIALSGGEAIAPQFALVLQELEASIATVFGLPRPTPPIPFGRGVDFAFGHPSLQRLESALGASLVDSLSAFLSTQEGMAILLTGPTDSAFQAMSQDFIEGATQHATAAEAARPSLKSVSPQFRKRMYAAALAAQLDREIREIVSKLGIPYDRLLALGPKGVMRLFGDTPCLDVEIELGTLAHAFWNRRSRANDMADITSLSSAIPYCDAVLAEKFWADLAQRAHLDTKYSTLITHSLPVLLDALGT